MRQRAYAVLRSELRELRGRLPAPAQDHERDQPRERDEEPRALPIRRPYEADCTGRKPGLDERRPEHVVDERRDRAQRRATGAQHSRVEALEELTRDVERDVRPRLEVRPDDADRDPALAHTQSIRERPRRNLPLERRDPGHRLDLGSEALDPHVVEREAVEHPRVETVLCVGHVRGVRSEHERPPLPHENARAPERFLDEVVSQRRDRVARGGRFPFDVRAKTHFTSYTGDRTRGKPRSASREAEGPAL